MCNEPHFSLFFCLKERKIVYFVDKGTMKEVQRLRQMLKWSRANILHLMGVYIQFGVSLILYQVRRKDTVIFILQISNCKSRKLRNCGQVHDSSQHRSSACKMEQITITVTCFYLLYQYYYIIIIITKISPFSIFFSFFILKQRLNSAYLIKSWQGEGKNAWKALLNRKQCLQPLQQLSLTLSCQLPHLRKCLLRKDRAKSVTLL